MNFAERLKELRNKTDLSQERLSVALGYGKSTVASWEVGRTQPSIEGLIALAKYFNVTVDYLIGKSDFSITPQQHNMLEVFPREKILIAAYRQLPPSQQVMICRQLGIVHESELAQYLPNAAKEA